MAEETEDSGLVPAEVAVSSRDPHHRLVPVKDTPFRHSIDRDRKLLKKRENIAKTAEDSPRIGECGCRDLHDDLGVDLVVIENLFGPEEVNIRALTDPDLIVAYGVEPAHAGIIEPPHSYV